MLAEVLSQVSTRQLPARHTAKGSTPPPNQSDLGHTGRAEQTRRDMASLERASPSTLLDPFPINATHPSGAQPSPGPTSHLTSGQAHSPREGCAS